MKKVAILTNSSSGLWSFRRELIAKLAEQYQVVIFTPCTDCVKELRSLGAKVVDTPVDRRGTNPLSDLRLLLTYKKLLRIHWPHLAITYTIKPNIYGSMAAKALGIPVVANITGLGTAFEGAGFVNKLVVCMYKRTLAYAKLVFFENTANCDYLCDLGLLSKSKTHVLAGAGVNLEHYWPQPYPLAQIGEDNPFRFLFIGRIMKEKGIEELLDAIKRLHNASYRVLLEVLGTYEEDYSAQFDQAQREGWLKYYGEQSDVRPFVAQAHCFVLPSYHEGMANTNLECSAMARPIITSNIPGCKEAVVDGVTGFTCEPKDADSLYSAMKKMIDLPKEARAKMGQEARKHMEKVFDKKVVVADTIAQLNQYVIQGTK